MMEFLFLAPFRTDFNLSSLEAISDREAIVDVLLQTVQLENEGESGFHWLVPWSKEDKGELHYSDLNEDLVPDSATPLLTLKLPETHIRDQLALQSEANELDGYDINKCSISYFDNTVGILTLEISVSANQCYEYVFANVDRWSTKICSAIVKLIEPHEFKIQEQIRSISKTKHKNLFLKSKEFTVFFDRLEESATNTKKSKERMLWVTRIHMTPAIDQDQSKVLEKWTQSNNLTDNSLSIDDTKISACVGNSLTIGNLSKQDKNAVETALQLSTYFYVLYNVFNKILKLLYLDLANRKNTTASTIERANRIRAHIEFIENEFGDVLMGLQGKRAAIAKKFLGTWNYIGLVDAVQNKKESVTKFTGSILSERQNKYGRVVEAFLAAIGGVSLLDFILNLFSFSKDNNTNSDSIFGLVDAVQHTSVDGVLYAALALLIFVLTLVLRKR